MAEKDEWRGLPSGYTQVEYIESSGTQYIDTGFKPNSNTRVVMDFQFISAPSSDHAVIFGARDSANVNSFCVFYIKDGYFRSDYNTTNTNQWAINSTTRYTIDKNKETTSIGNTTQSYSATTFKCSYNLYLFALNTGGALGFRSQGLKVYSCQIYDNGTLIRDYVPCVNADGKAGLYDMVNGLFYTNAGTGNFVLGVIVHMPNGMYIGVDGVVREIDKSYIGINGVVRNNKKGYLGDENGVTRECFSSREKIGLLPVGSSVFMNLGGVRTEFLVVHHGLPSSAYHSSCDGTWLLTKDVYDARNWEETNAAYSKTKVHNYLNTDFINLFDDNIKSIIKKVKIPYDLLPGSTGPFVLSGSSGLETLAFLLSWTEVGFSQTGTQYVPVEGAVLSYFNDGGNLKRIAYYNGSALRWDTRTPYPWGSFNQIACVEKQGTYGLYDAKFRYYTRPALILPSSTIVNGDFDVIE